ncbi:YcaO-like family protein [Halodesulfovibrio aestuarii]|uniref:YcaO-like family protein n=1 Tax=Halodesulfovibrio aestuarii TaxID=126333 RepID=UPI00054DEEBA
MSSPMKYKFNLSDTVGTVGYVSCEPPADMTFDEALAYLEEHPLDDFMHKHLLTTIRTFDQKKFKTLLNTAVKEYTVIKPVLAALLYETCLLYGKFSKLLALFPNDATEQLQEHTPLIYIRWYKREDKYDHIAWITKFKENIHEHRMLPLPDVAEDFDLPMLYEPNTEEFITAATIREELLKTPYDTPWTRPPAQDTTELALKRLNQTPLFADVEMRHIASLSPIALLRRWNIDLTVKNGALDYTLQGHATSYGRGLALVDARVGLTMEIVERSSSFVSFDHTGVLNSLKEHPLTHARYSELMAQGITAFDPNLLSLEVPYEDEKLYWIEGHTPKLNEEGYEPILVPVQMVYMFCNLDEISLFSSPGSTGLASGNILEEAKVAALMEIFERDAEATKPFNKKECFILTTEDQKLNMLLNDYAARGVHVMFQDITPEFGIPCYYAFVMGKRGEVYRGTGSGLDGRKAIVSALTETPYPYPQSPPSAPALHGIETRKQGELPDVSMEDPIRNLQMLEKMLIANNRRPVYVELARKDLQFPVVKALIPNMELTADFDSFTRVSHRLFTNYLRMEE